MMHSLSDRGRFPGGRALWTWLVLLLAAASAPRFFTIYRSAAFETTPRDPYEAYVLHLAGEPGGYVPSAPHAHRLFSVAVAVPVYRAVPLLYTFSRLESVDPRRLRATQAMALVSYLALAGLCLAAWVATRRLGAGAPMALGAVLAAWILAEGTQLLAMDSVALCLVAWLSLSLPKPRSFVPLILLSAGFNEKIPLIFLALLLSRRIARARASERSAPLWPQTLAAASALALWATARVVFPVAGGEHQTDPSAFAWNVLNTATLAFSAKGALLTLLPALSVAALWAMARNFQSDLPLDEAGAPPLFHPADLAALIVLAAAAFAARIEFGVGRVLLYCFPLYLPAAFAALEQGPARERGAGAARPGASGEVDRADAS